MKTKREKNKINHALILSLFAFSMLVLSYAAFPLYKIFCQVTGFGGTPQIANENKNIKIFDSIDIRFDSTTEKDSDIIFEPENNKIKIQIGENNLAFYKAVNKTDKRITTMSVFNVTPLQAGKYFNKIECFCFEEQILSPKEEVSMPVSFFIDPAIKDDKFIKDLKEITLSYTMFIK